MFYIGKKDTALLLAVLRVAVSDYDEILKKVVKSNPSDIERIHRISTKISEMNKLKARMEAWLVEGSE